jgi:hypothetical protein
MGCVFQVVGDFGSILSGALINIGDKLGLFQAMTGSVPMTCRTRRDDRNVRALRSRMGERTRSRRVHRLRRRRCLCAQ